MGYYAHGGGWVTLRFREDDVFGGMGQELVSRDEFEELLHDTFEEVELTPMGDGEATFLVESYGLAWPDGWKPFSLYLGGKYFGDLETLTDAADTLGTMSLELCGDDDDYVWRTAKDGLDEAIYSHSGVSVFPSHGTSASLREHVGLIKELAKTLGVDSTAPTSQIFAEVGAKVAAALSTEGATT